MLRLSSAYRRPRSDTEEDEEVVPHVPRTRKTNVGCGLKDEDRRCLPTVCPRSTWVSVANMRLSRVDGNHQDRADNRSRRRAGVSYGSEAGVRNRPAPDLVFTTTCCQKWGRSWGRRSAKQHAALCRSDTGDPGTVNLVRPLAALSSVS